MNYSFLQSHMQRRHLEESQIGMYFNVIKKIRINSLEKCKYSEDVQSMLLCNWEEWFSCSIFRWQISICVNASNADWQNVLGDICFSLWKIINKKLYAVFTVPFQTRTSTEYFSQQQSSEHNFSLGMCVMKVWVKWTSCPKENKFCEYIWIISTKVIQPTWSQFE